MQVKNNTILYDIKKNIKPELIESVENSISNMMGTYINIKLYA